MKSDYSKLECQIRALGKKISEEGKAMVNRDKVDGNLHE